MIYDLGYRPREWQQKIHSELKRFSVLVCHRRAGKTILAIMTLLNAALSTQKKDARYAYICPFLKQSKSVAWDYLKRYATKVPGIQVNESELRIQLPNGARIQLYGADNADSLRGIYLDGVVLDEVSDFHPTVWGEILRPTLADRKGWALFIGTPKGINLFSELYFRAKEDPDWYANLLTVDETEAIPIGELIAMRAEMSEEQYRQELMCDFGAGNKNALLTAFDVEQSVRRVIPESAYLFAGRCLGVDVARFGDDRTCFIRRHGLKMYGLKTYRGLNSVEVASHIIDEIIDFNPDAIFIDGTGGHGAGAIDRLRMLGHDCIDVQFAGKATNPKYVNKRTEIWCEMAMWIRAHGWIPNDLDLKRDLTAVTYDYKNAAGQMRLESKEDIKKRGMPSPDAGDAAALTFAFPVHPRQRDFYGTPQMNNKALMAYNPLLRP